MITFVITNDIIMKTVLTPDQKEANEKFFRMMIGTIFTRKMGKFYGNQSDIDAIRDLVNDDFFYIYFENLDELQPV